MLNNDIFSLSILVTFLLIGFVLLLDLGEAGGHHAATID